MARRGERETRASGEGRRRGTTGVNSDFDFKTRIFVVRMIEWCVKGTRAGGASTRVDATTERGETKRDALERRGALTRTTFSGS